MVTQERASPTLPLVRALLRFAPAALMLLSPSAGAIPLTWTLQDVTLTDGQTLTGSFTYDRTTGVFAEIAVVNSGSVDHPTVLWDTAFYFSAPRPGTAPLTAYFMSGPAGSTNQVLGLDWSQYGVQQGLNDDGGVVTLRAVGTPGSPDAGVYLNCGQIVGFTGEMPEVVLLPDCAGADVLQGDGGPYVVGGTLAAVPLPATGWLLATALAGLVGRVRSKS